MFSARAVRSWLRPYGISWHAQNLTGDWHRGKRQDALWRLSVTATHS